MRHIGGSHQGSGVVERLGWVVLGTHFGAALCIGILNSLLTQKASTTSNAACPCTSCAEEDAKHLASAQADLLAVLQSKACLQAAPCAWAAGEGMQRLLTAAKQVGRGGAYRWLCLQQHPVQGC
jgi:hypothetical protein